LPLLRGRAAAKFSSSRAHVAVRQGGSIVQAAARLGMEVTGPNCLALRAAGNNRAITAAAIG
jgi:hypothetical protein